MNYLIEKDIQNDLSLSEKEAEEKKQKAREILRFFREKHNTLTYIQHIPGNRNSKIADFSSDNSSARLNSKLKI